MNLENYVPVKVKGYEKNYLVNKDTCQVYSKLSGNIQQGFNVGGYIRVWLKREDGVRKSISLHKIMIETFKPDRRDFKYTERETQKDVDLTKLVPNHIDGNKLNNTIENLEWCTRAYNNKEAYRLGLRVVSEKTKSQFRRDCLDEKHIKKSTKNLLKYGWKGVEKSSELKSKRLKVIKDGKEYVFNSCTDAAKFLGLNKASVCRALKSYKTYKGRQNLIIEPLEK